MEARVTRLVNVFNYANVAEKEEPELPVFFCFIDRRERADEVQLESFPEWRNFVITYNNACSRLDFHTFHWLVSTTFISLIIVEHTFSSYSYYVNEGLQIHACVSRGFSFNKTFDIAEGSETAR